MKVLILSKNDWSGAGYSWYEALNGLDDCEARMVCWHVHPFRYPCDKIGTQGTELMDLIEWADVLNLHDDVEDILPAARPKRPVVMTYHGSWYRGRWRDRNAYDAERGYLSTGLTIDLSLNGLEWIGRAMPNLASVYEPARDAFWVCHAPTNRWAKGTAHVQKAVSMLEGVELRLVENVPNQECLRIKGSCHVCVDQVSDPSQRNPGYGYGTNALEAWALGMPVISCALVPEVRSAIEAIVGYLPFLEACSLVGLLAGLTTMRDSGMSYGCWAALGKKYVRAWHDPVFVGNKLVTVFERAIGGAK